MGQCRSTAAGLVETRVWGTVVSDKTGGVGYETKACGFFCRSRRGQYTALFQLKQVHATAA